ncbi:hypothetical protein ACLI1A_07080 [Flavobacterium sp. RHBU_3]|uniref:hypothetical protein n=1 Tax=Flavobacterium sp. RHBU_3 TaxID=3391184 RepID=UPI0039848D56
MKKSKPLLTILIVIFVLVFYDNLSPVSKGEVTTTDWGSNTDIVDGRLSGAKNYTCVFILNGNDTVINENGKHRIIIKETERSFGILSYLPIYKNIKPTIKFDCYLENPNRYIGKVEIQKSVVAVGATREWLKEIIIKQYMNDCMVILHSKLMPYDIVHDTYNKHPDYASAYCGTGSPKLTACLSDGDFYRKIPVREKDKVYTDTILMTPDSLKEHAKYEVFTVNKNGKEIRFKSIGNDGNVLYSEVFNLKKWQESATMYQSFAAYPKS